MSGLYGQAVGHGRPRFVFLHGLFGQGKNWTAIAKGLADDGPSLLIDLPNHGRSPWTETFSYEGMADAVAANLESWVGRGARPVLVGHSMGGKTAMALALRRPDLVGGLVVVDIAPDDSSHGYGFARLVAALRNLDLAACTSRQDADRALASEIPDADVRAFLLQNLHRTKAGFHWQPNLDLIAAALPAISGFGVRERGPVDLPVLWVRGGESSYVRDEHVSVMHALFPDTTLVTIDGAGHWVNADAPEAVIEAIHAFALERRLVPRGGPVGPLSAGHH